MLNVINYFIYSFYICTSHRSESTGTEIRAEVFQTWLMDWTKLWAQTGVWCIAQSCLFYENTPPDGYFWIVPLHQDVRRVGVPSEGKKGAGMKASGHPLIVIVEYLFSHISTNSPTEVLIN